MFLKTVRITLKFNQNLQNLSQLQRINFLKDRGS